MSSEYKLILTNANVYFMNKDYDLALFEYSKLLSKEPNNEIYKLYAIFCDIASEDELKAISLFDYLTLNSSKNLEDSIKYCKNVIKLYDSDMDNMISMLDKISVNKVDLLDAITYEDFKQSIKNRGSFKIAFEDIMFSSKISIDSKEDFFDFVTQLIDNDFNAIAYNYLDEFNQNFSYDMEIEVLYKKLEDKKLDFKNIQ
jgi:tetratricopeptide (TPR) repeat protein